MSNFSFLIKKLLLVCHALSYPYIEMICPEFNYYDVEKLFEEAKNNPPIELDTNHLRFIESIEPGAFKSIPFGITKGTKTL